MYTACLVAYCWDNFTFHTVANRASPKHTVLFIILTLTKMWQNVHTFFRRQNYSALWLFFKTVKETEAKIMSSWNTNRIFTHLLAKWVPILLTCGKSHRITMENDVIKTAPGHNKVSQLETSFSFCKQNSADRMYSRVHKPRRVLTQLHSDVRVTVLLIPTSRELRSNLTRI